MQETETDLKPRQETGLLARTEQLKIFIHAQAKAHTHTPQGILRQTHIDTEGD